MEKVLRNGKKNKCFKFIWKDKESGMGFVSDTAKFAQFKSVLFQYQKVKGAFFFSIAKKHKISFLITKRQELICSDFT